MVAFVVVSIKYKNIVPVFLGALCFLVTQICIRIPIITIVLPKFAWFSLFKVEHPILYVVLLALTAGIVEELGRYLFMKLGRQNQLSQGVAFGIGHGGIEDILLVGISVLSYLMQPSTIGYVPQSQFFMATVERLSALMVHIGLSIFVLYSLRTKNSVYLWLAVMVHGFFDFLIVYLADYYANGWIAETTALLLSIGLLLSAIIWNRRFQNEKDMDDNS